ncbi:T9SS type B sorting domain-containing protein [Portibacter lacus]|uniref:Gliding motility-associated C-terminal domain-containing protein n=1 Tax=Portibacter lacus TaxID=1099794 RepID=A0AA37SQ04_9BACT|nr:gliding motility-associated C-terminal domain-containing protein [Portibacter lacus]GLR17422.1 hypothetical protein GCM10007940_20370 [Portibacter lacus]
MRIVLMLLLVFAAFSGRTQEFLANDSNGRLVKLNMDGCVTQSLGNIGSFTDIAAHPDGFIYAITANGELHRVDLQGANVEQVAKLQGSSYYALTASSTGLIYAATGGGTLKSYEPATDEIRDYPNMGYGASGDLTFYKGQLYMASFTNELVRIHPENPALNTAIIDFASKNVEIFGIVSTLYECEIRTFAISGDFTARVFEIGWEDGSFNEFCTVNARIYGGSSEFEFKGSRDVLFVDSYRKSNEFCDSADVSVTLTGDGIGDDFSYSLDNINFQSSPTFTGLDYGKHYIYLKNELGCEGKDSIFLEPGNLTLSIAESVDASCDEDNGEVYFTIETNADSFNITGYGSVNSIADLEPAAYLFTIKDTDGCEDSVAVDIAQLPALEIESLVIEATLCGDDNGRIEIETNRSEYQVMLDEMLVNNSIINDLQAKEYLLSVVDEAGCRIDTTIQVSASPDCNIYIPNIFSPNDDGFNDVFEVYSPDRLEILESRVYDRWGSILYQQRNGLTAWDGRFNGVYVEPGIYTYFIKVQGKAKLLEFVGEVSLTK